MIVALATTTLEKIFLEHWRDALEIALIWFVLYQSWLRLRNTQGIRILTAVAISSLAFLLASELLDLPVLDWVLRNVAALALFTLVVIFQPELRRSAARFGRSPLFPTPGRTLRPWSC